MPDVRKVTAEEFNTKEQRAMGTKNCNPSVQVFDGMKVQISDEFGVKVRRGQYKTVIFVPNALLGEIRWNQVFRMRTNRWAQVVTNDGVAFLFGRVQATAA